jgi:hypothetical protein
VNYFLWSVFAISRALPFVDELAKEHRAWISEWTELLSKLYSSDENERMSGSINLTEYVNEVVSTTCFGGDMNCHSTLSEYATWHDNCESNEHKYATKQQLGNMGYRYCSNHPKD